MSDRSALGDYLENLPLRILAGVTKPLAPAARGRVGAWAARRALRNVPGLKRRVYDNLAHVYPGISEARKAEILDGMAANLGRTIIEILHPQDFRATADRFTWSGEEGLQAILEAHEAGTGAVSLSGHYGQWEATRTFMLSKGINVGAIYRPLKNRYSEQDLARRYAAFGTPLFPKSRKGTRDLVRYLAKGNILGILHDQKIDDGLLLDFMGQPAATAPLAAELALKFKVPLIAAYATRGPDLTSIHIEFDPPIPHTTAREMTQAINDGLAARVHAHPEQYYWLHRRWQIRNPKHLETLAEGGFTPSPRWAALMGKPGAV